MALFILGVRLESPNNKRSKSLWGLSGKKFMPKVWSLLNKRCLAWEYIEQCKMKCCEFSIEFVLHAQKGFKVSRKPCLNLCSLRWLKPNRRRVRKTTPWLSRAPKTGGLGLINSKIAFLKVETEGRSLIRPSKLFHCEMQ